MRLRQFNRNIRAGEQLDIFLVSAVSGLLLVRFYLHITNYPQLGSGGLHIAHMLWGGALMLAALILLFSFLGSRNQRFCALIGGTGFGIFIDELGKFITADNNYFYRPAIGIIYAIFIALYLLFNFLGRARPLTSREYQLNALAQLEEAIAHDMDKQEESQVHSLLHKADQKDFVTQHLLTLLEKMDTVPVARPNRFKRYLNRLDDAYLQFREGSHSRALVRGVFLGEALLIVGAVMIVVYRTVDSGLDVLSDPNVASKLLLGQLISSLLAAGFAAWGAWLLPLSRLQAYERFRAAILTTIFLTQFFMFSRIAFGALPLLCLNILLLGVINYAIRQERIHDGPC